MGINKSMFYYDFSKVYDNFKMFIEDKLVDELSFEKINSANIIKLLNTIDEHYDFNIYLKKYNEYRRIDDTNFIGIRKTYVSNSGLDRLVGKYVNNKKYRGKGKLEYTCYLLDGILSNVHSWR